jgi:hypothetical protein
MRLPEQHELIGFFGSEPRLADLDVPWTYNRLTFSTEAGSDTIEVDVSPGFDHLRLLWRQDQATRLDLDLNNVEWLAVEETPPCLVVGFAESLPLGELRLRLGPHVSVFWVIHPSN